MVAWRIISLSSVPYELLDSSLGHVSDPLVVVKASLADNCRLAQVELYIKECIHKINRKRDAKLKHFNQFEILTK